MKFSVPATILSAVMAFGVTGCDSSSPEPANNDSTPAMHDGMMHNGMMHDHGGESGASAKKIDAALAKLSPEDAASARAQKICPVSGEPLGTMGTPIKMNVEGQNVWICCDGCKGKILDNPDKYLSNIK